MTTPRKRRARKLAKIAAEQAANAPVGKVETTLDVPVVEAQEIAPKHEETPISDILESTTKPTDDNKLDKPVDDDAATVEKSTKPLKRGRNKK